MLMKVKEMKGEAKGPTCGACLADVMDCLEEKQKCDSALSHGEDTAICAPFNKCKLDATTKCITAGSCTEAEAEHEADDVYPTTMIQQQRTSRDALCASCLVENVNCMDLKKKCDADPSDCDGFRVCEEDAKSACVKDGACSLAEAEEDMAQIDSDLSSIKLSLHQKASKAASAVCAACLAEEMNCLGDIEKCNKDPSHCDASKACEDAAKARCVQDGVCSAAEATKELKQIESDLSQVK
jgi:hypothetical protein